MGTVPIATGSTSTSTVYVSHPLDLSTSVSSFHREGKSVEHTPEQIQMGTIDPRGPTALPLACPQTADTARKKTLFLTRS